MLARILERKQEEVAALRAAPGARDLRRRALEAPATRSFPGALRRDTVALIAEIKRASPSRGQLAARLDPGVQARLYESGGAAAISVLTDQAFFGGSLADLAAVKRAVSLPVLRKDFVVDPIQLYEARASGADAVLLIVTALPDSRLAEFLTLSGEIGLACLVEAHDAQEVARAVDCGASIIGINNRDLRTFAVDLATCERLAPLVPADRVLVAESGVHALADVRRLAAAGADAVLVGEALVTAPDPAVAARALAGVARRPRLVATGGEG